MAFVMVVVSAIILTPRKQADADTSRLAAGSCRWLELQSFFFSTQPTAAAAL